MSSSSQQQESKQLPSSTAPAGPLTNTDTSTSTTDTKKDAKKEGIKLKNLQKPIFDNSLFKKNDGTVSGSLLTVNAEEPFLCTPLSITESNLLAWLFRGDGEGEGDDGKDNNGTSSNTDMNNNNNENITNKYTKSNTHLRRRNNSNRSKYDKRLPDSFIKGEELRYAVEEAKELRKLKNDYHSRRELNRLLASRLELGTATIDVDGRLVHVDTNNQQRHGHGHMNNGLNNDENNGNNNNNLGFDAHIARGIEGRDFGNGDGDGNGNGNENFHRHNNNIDGDDFLDGDDDGQMMLNEEDPGFLPAVFGVAAQDWLDDEEERRRNIERQEIEAEEVILSAVNKYRDEGVPEDDFFFVPIQSRYDNDDNNLTCRRILIAVGCVLAAFICIMMQSFNLIEDVKIVDPTFDKLLYDLLNVRSFGVHILECNDLQRDNVSMGLIKDKNKNKKINCDDDVLHIPPIHILSQLDESATADKYLSSLGLEQIYEPYKNGVNASWFHECVLLNPPNSTCVLQREYPTDNGEKYSKNDTCKDEALPPTACFRGVHDGMITDDEISQVINLGKFMVSKGGDHMTIYQDIEPLYKLAPSVPDKLESILRSKYATPKIRPIAFQVSMSFPIAYTASSQAIKGTRRASIIEARNETVYKNWYNQVQRINNWPKLFTPMQTPYRDQCLLVSDLEASEEFAFHTSVYLSDGAGEDFSGGVSLFVDNHKSNTNPRKKIHRGITIDGSRGRIVVNSGGEDNIRCRLPMRGGIRVELNVWWNCA